MPQKRMAPFNITDRQYEWLKAEKKRTGNTFAAIVRSLIQAEAEKGQGKK